jgi:centrosomal protein CEP120
MPTEPQAPSQDEPLVLRIHVHEGRGFGGSSATNGSPPIALLCSAAFCRETKSTPYSVGGDSHAWNSTLTWSISKEAARRLSSCKVQVLRQDGVRMGWLVLDLRSARLQQQYSGGISGVSQEGRYSGSSGHVK